ncbi:hypothetical protein INT48_007752 [Thamnidium elegans]|uniref:Uncharacterized protein n=1 Tax=Thamnidium elegans TaxID=101142 RepID=A0A8H7VST3_9FUNG|nr:hypothetical protein INT48_007752 [Thamnidium elegans]
MWQDAQELFRYNDLLIVESHPIAEHHFPPHADRLYNTLYSAGIIDHVAIDLEQAQVNVVYFTEDDDVTNIRDLDGPALTECCDRLHKVLLLTQPSMAVVVGLYLLKLFFVLDQPVSYGFYDERVWEDTGRLTVVYSVPNTRHRNRSMSVETMQR